MLIAGGGTKSCLVRFLSVLPDLPDLEGFEGKAGQKQRRSVEWQRLGWLGQFYSLAQTYGSQGSVAVKRSAPIAITLFPRVCQEDWPHDLREEAPQLLPRWPDLPWCLRLSGKLFFQGTSWHKFHGVFPPVLSRNSYWLQLPIYPWPVMFLYKHLCVFGFPICLDCNTFWGICVLWEEHGH